MQSWELCKSTNDTNRKFRLVSMLVKNRSNGKNYYEIGNKPACVRCLTDAIGISSRTLIKYSKKDLTSVGMRGKHTHRPRKIPQEVEGAMEVIFLELKWEYSHYTYISQTPQFSKSLKNFFY